MTALQKRKVDRNQVYKEVSRLIKESKNGEVEISSSDLSDRFGVQAPTMDYHLNKLVVEGRLSISPKRGRYNRKIYRIPSKTKSNDQSDEVIEEKQTQVHIPFSSPESKSKYEEFLKSHAQHKQESEEQKEASEEQKQSNEVQEASRQYTAEKTESVSSPDWDEYKRTSSIKEEDNEENVEEYLVEESSKSYLTMPAQSGKSNLYMDKELTLDEEVQRFLEETNRVHNAEALLKHEDREILSVMNETINQTTVYLKDLSEQLSTVANKQLIQHLIDDRNRMQAKMERLEKDAEEARSQVNQTKEKYEVSPDRVRFMQQMIISTVDDYVNQTNQSLALGRKDFRNKVSKEVRDLVKYVLHLEE